MGRVPVVPLVATLRQLLKPPPGGRSGERCELCEALLSDDHGHVVDTRTRRLLCACAICGAPQDARPAVPRPVGEGGRYRAVPPRSVRPPRTTLSLAEWDTLGIPVDLAFFFYHSGLGRVVACYPGPAGAAESLLPLDAWPALVAGNSSMQPLVPDVEALLVRRAADEYAAFIVPIDVCYELVGRIRQTWMGFGGGDAGRRAIDEFLATVLEPTATASTSAACRPRQDREERR